MPLAVLVHFESNHSPGMLALLRWQSVYRRHLQGRPYIFERHRRGCKVLRVALLTAERMKQLEF